MQNVNNQLHISQEYNMGGAAMLSHIYWYQMIKVAGQVLDRSSFSILLTNSSLRNDHLTKLPHYNLQNGSRSRSQPL